MTHTYQVAGITCAGCVAKVTTLLEKVSGVTATTVGIDGNVQVAMSYHVPTADLQAALKDYPKYQLSETAHPKPIVMLPEEDIRLTFGQTYKPILLVFGYILGVTLLVEVVAEGFDGMRWMRHFMAGFFLAFSFFKLLDVPGFAIAYSSYDLVARRWLGWGYVYPFVELALGILFLVDFNPLITNGLTFMVMGVSTLGVVQSLLAKRQFQCACLGAVFHLPMSTLTLVEDALMVVMAGAMLVVHL